MQESPAFFVVSSYFSFPLQTADYGKIKKEVSLLFCAAVRAGTVSQFVFTA
jgi:hypothetical protein